MASVAVLAPVLNRPERAPMLSESFTLALNDDHRMRLVPICSLDDLPEINAWLRLGIQPEVVNWRPGPGDWAKKINWGFRRMIKLGFEWMLLGADDLGFHPGWFDAALTVHHATDACVIGTNDLGNPTVKRGHHSTHPLVFRDYLECGTIDEPNQIVCELYSHNWVDTELVETAKARGTWAFAADSHVEHLHPFWGKSEMDDVYAKGRANFHDDRRLFESRRELWEEVAVA